jgi:hypothetical protein
MGREKEPEKMHAAELLSLSELIGEYSQSLGRIVNRMQTSEVDSVTVRHVQKGKLAIKNLGEFVAMVEKCLREEMFSTAFPALVAEQKTTYKTKKPKPKE